MTRGNGITLDSVVSSRPDLVAAPMDDKLVMLDLAKGKYFGLDDIATAIWTAIAAPVRVADLCADLMARYDVAPETCRADTLEFLNQLREEGLVEVHESPGR
jgi:hypothetical protein